MCVFVPNLGVSGLHGSGYLFHVTASPSPLCSAIHHSVIWHPAQ